MVKNLPAVQETQVQSLGREDLLEEERQPTPGLLPGEFLWTEEPGGHSPWGCKESDTTERLSLAEKNIFMSSFYELRELQFAQANWIILKEILIF